MIDVASQYGYSASAIRAAVATGQDLYWSSGKYLQDDVLINNGRTWSFDPGAVIEALDKAKMSIKLRGAGVQMLGPVMHTCPSAQLPSGPPNWTVRLSSGESKGLFLEPSCNGFVIDGFQVDRAGSSGIHSWGAYNGLIKNTKVYRTLADAYHFTNGSHDIELMFAECQDVGDDMFAVVSYASDGKRCHDIEMHDCVGNRQVWGRGITVVGGYSIKHWNMKINGTDGAGALFASEDGDYITYGVFDVEMSDCVFTDVDRRGIHGCSILISGMRAGYPVDTVYGSYNETDPNKDDIRKEGEYKNITVEGAPPTTGGDDMAVEHMFAPKDKPLGNMPLPTDAGKTILPAAWDGFKRCDLPMIADRNQIVMLDGEKVLQNTLIAGDTSGYSGTFRNEYYRDDFYYPGDTVYFELGFMLPANFPSAPIAWGGLFQIHTPWTAPDPYDSPMFIIWPSAGKLRIRNDAEGGVDFETDWLLDRFHYWRGAITMGHSSIAGKPGHVKVWYSSDKRPSDTQVVIDKQRNTCPPEEMHWSHNQDGSRKARTGSYEKDGIYLPPGTPGMFRHYRDAFVSSPAGLDRVAELFTAKCRTAALGTTPEPEPGDLDVHIVTQTSTSVTLGWTPPAEQEGYLPLIDGSEILTDGKRHPGTKQTQDYVKIGKKLDGQPHDYGVSILVQGPTGKVRI